MVLGKLTILRYKGFQIAIDYDGHVVEVQQRHDPIAGAFPSMEAVLAWLDQVIECRQRQRTAPKPPNPPKPAATR
jgi:hypothetical protein